MKIAFYTNVISPHTAPLVRALACYTKDIVYIYNQRGGEPCRSEHALKGLEDQSLYLFDDQRRAMQLLEDSECLITGVRDLKLMEKRVANGKVTLYQSERWFKPICLASMLNPERGGRHFWIEGFGKIYLPFAFRRAFQISKLFKSNKFLYLPIGVHAAGDMARLCGLMNGNLNCLFKAPRLDIDRTPCGEIHCSGDQDARRYCLDRMRLWGYFVESFKRGTAIQDCTIHNPLRVLWVGRMLGWKRVDTLIKAIGGMKDISLSVYGGGPEEIQLKRIVSSYDNITVGGMVPISKVREIMRNHDVYVLTSNEFEGWGAVVNEALEEGMEVVGTFEAGASATILHRGNLFHAGDWRGLRRLLLSKHKRSARIGEWSVDSAARKLIELMEDLSNAK